MRPGLWPAEVTPRCEMVRADRASRHHVLPSSSATFASARTDAAFSRSHFGVQNGAPRRRAGAGLSRRGEDELARAQRIRQLRTLAARLAALRAPLPENSSDFAMLCAQVYVERCHRGSFVNLQQCRASSQPAGALQGRSVRFSGRPARARQHAEACEASGERSISYGARAASRTRFT